MNTIAFAASKGGTGKTTITFNVATLLATEYDKKILIMDTDPQHNSSNLFNYKIEIDEEGNKYRLGGIEDIYIESAKASEVIQKTQFENIDIIGSTFSLTGLEINLTGRTGREFILKNWFKDNQKELEKYDYVFIDSNPTMSTLNVNAFHVADSIILVSDVDIDSIYAVDIFREAHMDVCRSLGRDDNIKGLVINKLSDNTNVDSSFMSFIEDDDFEHKDILLQSKIHTATALRETKLDKEPIQKDRLKRGYTEFIDLIEELKEREIL